MFLLENNGYKGVVYFGKGLDIPSNINYIATDSDGEIYGYAEKPEQIGTMWNPIGDEAIILGNCTFQGNWEDSLMAVE